MSLEQGSLTRSSQSTLTMTLNHNIVSWSTNIVSACTHKFEQIQLHTEWATSAVGAI